MRRQHRHRPYHAEQSRRRSAMIRPIIAFVIVGALVLFTGKWLFDQLGFTGAVQRAAIVLTPEERGIVRVSIDGGEWKRADQDIKLYPGDRIEISAAGNANLSFFDGTFARLDEDTTIHLVESKKRVDGESEISIHMEQGILWIATPSSSVYPSSIKRIITTPLLRTDLLSRTEAVIHSNAIMLFDGDGQGSTVSIAGRNESVIVGEGQRFVLPEGASKTDALYSFRSAIDSRAVLSPFIEQSRSLFGSNTQVATGTGSTPTVVAPDNGLTISVKQPQDEEEIEGSTILVEGTYDAEVVNDVQVNGYGAELSGGVFSIEIAAAEEENIDIVVEAIALNGSVLDKISRTVHRNLNPPESPSFSSPAKDGEVYQTTQGKLQIIGTVGNDAVGIIVNDYRLQLFTPGSGEWKYLANVEYDNFSYGRNVFTAVAINKAGLRSEPATMTIILREDSENIQEGVIGGSTTTEGETTGEPVEEEEEDSVVNNENELPDNAPIAPGTLVVRAPSEGTVHNAKGPDESDLLIEGLAPDGTETIWVNGYRLRLFEPAKGFWNYIANTELKTLKAGRNEYVITARNAKGEVIDTLTYVINYDPSN